MLLRSVSHSYLPMLDWIQGYRKEWLRADVVAGLTGTAAVVIPKAMAYATIAGLPVRSKTGKIKDRVLQTLMVLSHDLRGPLTSLSAGLQLLVRGRYGPWMRMSFVH